MKEIPEKLHDLLRTFHDVTKLINLELELPKLIDQIDKHSDRKPVAQCCRDHPPRALMTSLPEMCTS